MRVPQSVIECLYRYIHLYMLNQYTIWLRNNIIEILKQLLIFGTFSYHFLKGIDIAYEYNFVSQVHVVVRSDHTIQYVTMSPFYSVICFSEEKPLTFCVCGFFFLLIIFISLNFRFKCQCMCFVYTSETHMCINSLYVEIVCSDKCWAGTICWDREMQT